MTMAQLLRELPAAVPLLREMGMDCGTCLSKVVDTIEMAACRHGLDLGEVLMVLNDLEERSSP